MSAAAAASIRLYLPASLQPAATEVLGRVERSPRGVPVEGLPFDLREAAGSLVSLGLLVLDGGTYRIPA